MIKKSLLLAFVFLTVYYLIIVIMPVHNPLPEAPWYKNELKVSQLDSKRNTNPVIAAAGTSFTNALNLNTISKNSVNLAFGGHTSLDGVMLLHKYNIIPQCLLIEVNYANFDTTEWVEKYLVAGLFNRDKIPLFKYQNRPSVYCVSQLAYIFNYEVPAFSASSADIDTDYVENQIAFYSGGAMEKTYARDLHLYVMRIKEELKWFEDRDTKIIFVMMPYNPALCDLPFLETIRNEYRAYFTDDDYLFYLYPDCSAYFTYDGRHLTAEEGNKFIAELQAAFPFLSLP